MSEVLLFGSTDLAIAVAEAVQDAGLTLAGIVTVGDSFEISYSKQPIKNVRFADIPHWCAERNIQVVEFSDYASVLAQFDLEAIPVCLVAGWYHMVPRDVRNSFKLGCIGFHASSLPKLRGGAPLNWAILKGLTETAVTMFQLSEGVDDGLIYGQECIPVSPRATIGQLVEAAARASAKLVFEILPDVIDGKAQPVEQVGTPSYGLQRRPEDGHIEWQLPMDDIDRLVRAVSRPYSGAFTELDGQKVVVWGVEPAMNAPKVYGAPGQITRLPGSDLPHVVTGEGVLAILEASDDAGKSMMDLLRRSNQKRFSV